MKIVICENILEVLNTFKTNVIKKILGKSIRYRWRYWTCLYKQGHKYYCSLSVNHGDKHMFKANIKMCSKLEINALEWLNVNDVVLVLLLLTLNRCNFEQVNAGWEYSSLNYNFQQVWICLVSFHLLLSCIMLENGKTCCKNLANIL